MAQLVPYINFAGRSEEAAAFYRDVFGGEVEMHKDGDRVVQLEFRSGAIHLMGSDHQGDDVEIASSHGYGLVLNCDDETQLQDVYARLAEGGKDVFRPTDSGWGAIVAHCADRFGVSWMLNFDKE